MAHCDSCRHGIARRSRPAGTRSTAHQVQSRLAGPPGSHAAAAAAAVLVACVPAVATPPEAPPPTASTEAERPRLAWRLLSASSSVLASLDDAELELQGGQTPALRINLPMGGSLVPRVLGADNQVHERYWALMGKDVASSTCWSCCWSCPS
jgi:hypothetical protein